MTRLIPLLLVAAAPGFAQDDAQVKKVAETYLNALSGAGDEAGKDLLLGGMTMNAQLFSLENWKFKEKAPVKKEEGDLARALQLLNETDKASRTALDKLMGIETTGKGSAGSVTEISQADASKLLEPTRIHRAAFQKSHPVLAFALRSDKEVFWHPKNPMRSILAKAGPNGRYSVEVHLWTILSTEGPSKTPREWPLRVIRFKAPKVDTGWKVLPASDWNAD